MLSKSMMPSADTKISLVLCLLLVEVPRLLEARIQTEPISKLQLVSLDELLQDVENMRTPGLVALASLHSETWLYYVSSQKDNSKIAIDSHPSTSGIQYRNSGLPSQSTPKDYNRGSFPDAYQSINQLTEQSNGREDHWSNKLKKKELLPDEVVGSATDILRASSSFGNVSLSSML